MVKDGFGSHESRSGTCICGVLKSSSTVKILIKFLVLHCINLMIANIKILLLPGPRTSKKYSGLTVDYKDYFKFTFDFQLTADEERKGLHNIIIIM